MTLPVATPSLPSLPENPLPTSVPADAAAYAHGLMPGGLPPALTASGMSTQTLAVVALCTLLGLAIIAFAVLRGWQGWLALKSRELDLRARPEFASSPPAPMQDADDGMAATANLIELADLKERIRKLEAIASGVDL